MLPSAEGNSAFLMIRKQLSMVWFYLFQKNLKLPQFYFVFPGSEFFAILTPLAGNENTQRIWKINFMDGSP